MKIYGRLKKKRNRIIAKYRKKYSQFDSWNVL